MTRKTYEAFRAGVAALVLLVLSSCSDVEPTATEPSTDEATRIATMIAQIDTATDPGFVYAYEKTRFVPPPGKTLLIMGQTLQAIDEYTTRFSRRPLPGGWAAYWGIPSMEGVDNTYINEHGDRHNHQELVDRFPEAALQSALWMVGTWDVAARTAQGEFDPVIRDFAAWARTVERPIYLRIGYEFDGPHNELEPDDYSLAYRRIVQILRAEGAENIAFVWHSYASPTYKGYPVEYWYPGDDYVDWVAVSLFGHMYAEALNPEAEAVFDFARTRKKPVMVAEASPILGISSQSQDAWDRWFVNFLSLCYRKNVKAISFINQDWSQHPVAIAIGWRDARLQNNRLIAEAWFAETGQDRYLKASPTLFEQLGYAP